MDPRIRIHTKMSWIRNTGRNLVVASLRKKGDTIRWQNDRILAHDEELSPTFEEMILANVLGLIDARLPGYVRQKYQDLLGRAKGLMDYQAALLWNRNRYHRNRNFLTIGTGTIICSGTGTRYL
jgi:hypothetical protein